MAGKARTKQLLTSRFGPSSARLCGVGLLLVLTLGNPASQCRAETSANKTTTTYKLNASVFQFAGPPEKDKIYRYCTEEGVQAYSQKDFAKAEQLFSAAVSDAEKRKIQGPSLAMMLANLASAEREQQKLVRSRNTFRLAIAALQNSAPKLRGSVNYARALNYIAPQYGALLRKLRLEAQAKFIEDDPLSLLAAREDREPLTGRVERIEPTNIARPPMPARVEKRAPIEGAAEKTDLRRHTPFEDEKRTEPAVSGSGGGGSASIMEQPAEPVRRPESVTIRQTTYWEGQNMYDALKTALYYQSKGIDVSVMLERLALMAANRHDMMEVAEGDQLVPVKSVLLEFMQKGGTVLASKSWADKLGYATGGNLPPGIKLLSDEEMRDELFKRRGSIIEY